MKTFAPLTDARHKIGAAAVLGGVAILAAACGGQSGHAPGAGPKPQSSLTISVAAAHGAPRHWTLTCGPAGGTHPDPQAACAALADAKDPFAPVSGTTMCPMIPASPQTASISGTWDGKKISASYTRTNGCAAERWNQLSKVLGQVNPGGPMIPASGG
jgi:Subtilisin inhibitor-like